MTSSSKVDFPQYDFTISKSVATMETRLAEAEHIIAKQEILISELESDLRWWKRHMTIGA